jgi:hypothetical protein
MNLQDYQQQVNKQANDATSMSQLGQNIYGGLQQGQLGGQSSDVCPHCGYCKHCGRSGHQTGSYFGTMQGHAL